jgi:DME family drug/metabolite transporter
VALAPAAAGIALIALAGEDGTRVRPLAIATGLAAALTYALLVIGTKALTTRLHAATIAFWQDVIAAVCLLPALPFAGRLLPSDALEVGSLLLLGVVFTGVSGYLYISLLRRVTAQAVGILSLLEPVSAALLAWAILGEPLGAAVVAGGALILAAGALVVLAEPGDATAVEAGGLGSVAE